MRTLFITAIIGVALSCSPATDLIESFPFLVSDTTPPCMYSSHTTSTDGSSSFYWFFRHPEGPTKPVVIKSAGGFNDQGVIYEIFRESGPLRLLKEGGHWSVSYVQGWA